MSSKEEREGKGEERSFVFDHMPGRKGEFVLLCHKISSAHQVKVILSMSQTDRK